MLVWSWSSIFPMNQLNSVLPLTLKAVQVKVATSPARMEPGPERETRLAGSEKSSSAQISDLREISHIINYRIINVKHFIKAKRSSCCTKLDVELKICCDMM